MSALVGVGRIGAFHARTLASLAGVSRLTLADVDARARRSRSRRELGAAVVRTPEALVDARRRRARDRDIDARRTRRCCRSRPTARRAGVLREAGRARPRRRSTGIAEEVEPRGNPRPGRLPAALRRRLRRRARRGRERCARHAARRSARRPTTRRRRPEAYIAASGGIFRDLHIHDFDAIRFVTGQEVAEVYADGAVRETPWFAELRRRRRRGRGAPARATGRSPCSPGTRHDPLGYDVRLEVFGTRDSIAVGVDARTPLRSRRAGRRERRPTGYRDFVDRFEAAYRGELDAFVTAVRRRRPERLHAGRGARRARRGACRRPLEGERRPVSIEEVASAETVAG